MRPVKQAPCVECPFRRVHPPGWLGGGAHGLPEEYADLAHSDANVPCHMSAGFDRMRGEHDESELRPCAGLAIYRRNVCKMPREGEAAKAVMSVKGDTQAVFASRKEFVDHHSQGTAEYAKKLMAARREDAERAIKGAE